MLIALWAALMNENAICGRVRIDLGALKSNYRRLQAEAPGAETGAAVKANAYGLGLEACVLALSQAGCASFFVARPYEGELLRKILPDARIFILDGLYVGACGYYLQHRLIPALVSLEQAREWAAHAGSAPCALHVDSGIHRLGLSYDEFKLLCGEHLPLNVVLLMSHLASSERSQDPFNEEQLRRFMDFRKLLPGVKASLANSSGIFLGPEFCLDLTRPGIALYGGNPTPDEPNPMLPVARLEIKVLQLRDLPKGEATGYNSTWRAKRKTRLALLGGGYADGIPRRLSSVYNDVACVWIKGRLYPIVGRVSMDMLAVDVTGGEVLAGDYAEIFGHNISLDAAAMCAETISYELLTHLGSRYVRFYHS